MQFPHMHDTIQASLQQVLADIETILEKHNRKKESLQLLVVSKTHPFENIVVAKDCGMLLFGENKVQEFIKKKQDYATAFACDTDQITKDIEVHLIGTLQSNKIGKALHHFSCIQSVDSFALLEKIATHLKQQEQKQYNESTSDATYTQAVMPYPVFLQIRCSQYDYKHGFDTIDALLSAVEFCMQQKEYIDVRGVMTIAPFCDDEKIIREGFALTRQWAEHAWKYFGIMRSPDISMGMSNDYCYAIAEGSTMLRLGSKIFGVRK